MRQAVEIAVSGMILLVGGLVFGFGGTLIRMIATFNSGAESGTASPDQVTHGILSPLLSMVVGIPISMFGLCLVVSGAIAYVVARELHQYETARERV